MTGLGASRIGGLVGAVAAVAAATWVTIRFDLASLNAEALADWMRDSDTMGPAILVLLLIVQSIVSPLPSQPLLMAAGFVYGPFAGFGLGWLGVLLGAGACFGLARGLGRPVVARLVRAEQLAAVDAYVSSRRTGATFLTVVTLRLFAHFAFDIVSYSCGLIRVSFPWFLLATAVGEVPKVLLFTYVGAGLADAPGWLGTLIVAAGILGTVAMLRWIHAGATSPQG